MSCPSSDYDVFVLRTIRQAWVKYNELKSYSHAVVFCSFAAAAGCIWLVTKDKGKNIRDDLDLFVSSGLTRVCNNYVNTPVFLEKQFFYLKGV